MAPRGIKRAAPATAAAPEAKRANDFVKSQGVTKSTFNAVVDIIEHEDAQLSEDCVKMLRAAMPFSICVVKDQRHASQEKIINMVSEVSDEVVKRLDAKVVAATQAVAKVEEGESTIQDRLKQAEGQAAEADTSTQEKTKQLADLTEKVTAFRRSLKEVKTEQGRQEKRLAAVEKEKTHYDLTLNEHFRKIKELTWDEKEGAGLLKSMTAAAGKLGLEDSLKTALPTTVLKRERGPFDAMVIQSLEDALQKKVEALNGDITTMQTGIQEQIKTAEATQKDLDQATEAKTASAEDLSLAQEHENKSKEQLAEAKYEASHGEEILAKAKDDLRIAEETKQTFKDFNVAMFTELRDRTTPAPEAEALPADAEMAAETTA